MEEEMTPRPKSQSWGWSQWSGNNQHQGNEEFVCRENKIEKPLTKSMERHIERIQTNRVIDEKINIELIPGITKT